MKNIVIVGAQWGDEAKGKLVDALGQDAGVTVRYAGGNNAGHTVNDGGTTWKFNLLPSSILNPNCLSILSDGVVIDPSVLVEEIGKLKSAGREVNLLISDRAHVIFPHHRILDAAREKRRGKSCLGTTHKGIGPAYCDKAERIGLRMGDLIASETFAERLRERLEPVNHELTKLYGEKPIDICSTIEEYASYALRLAKYVDSVHGRIRNACRAEGIRVLFEGAQGTWLDPDYGTYPFVTSSHPVAAGACLGTGIGPRLIDTIICVAKAYTTRVGSGPLPTEMPADLAAHIREIGNEYGTTTGRDRRVGWFDAVVVKQACHYNSASFVSLGHLDVLCGQPTVKIAIGWTLNGQSIYEMPADPALYPAVEPNYIEVDGWSESVADCRSWDELPANCQAYIKRIEQLIEHPIGVISVGPRRDQTIWLNQ